MPEGIDKNGSETLVNAEVIGDQLDPAIAGLAGGNYVVVYRNWDADLGRYLIEIAIHEPDGDQTVTDLNSWFDYSLNWPDVSATADGGFLVAFVVEESEPGIIVAKFDATGNLVGSHVAVDLEEPGAPAHADQPTIAALPAGGYALTYGTGSGAPVQLLMSDDDLGAGMSELVQISDGTGVSYDYDPLPETFVVSAISDDLVAVAYVADGVQLRFVEGPHGDWTLGANATVAAIGQAPSLATLDNGNVVVTWETYDDLSSTVNVYARVYDATGAAVTGVIVVDTEFNNDEYDANVAAIDGGFIVAWRALLEGSGDPSEIMARTFDNDGAARGDAFAVSASDYAQILPEVTSLADGGLAFVWEAQGQDNPPEEASGIYTQAYTYALLEGADGVIQGVTLSSSSLSTGEDLDIDLIVANTGDMDWSDSYSVIYWSSDATFDSGDTEIGREGHGTLRAGEVDDNEGLSIDYDTLAALGDGYLFVVADGDGTLDEPDEDNNISGPHAIEIAEDPTPTGIDLEITSFAARDASLEDGQRLRLDLTVTNNGDTAASAVKTTFYWSSDAVFDGGDSELGIDGHGKLGAGEIDDNERFKMRFDDIAQFGDGFIFAKIDAVGVHAEFDETNNVSGPIAIDLPEPADLEILSFSARDTTLDDGQRLKLDLTVTNSGETKAKGVKTTVYWSADNALDGGDVVLGIDGHGKLTAGEVDDNEKLRVSYSDLEALGDGYVFAVIDAGDEHLESDEGNNTTAGIFIDLL